MKTFDARTLWILIFSLSLSACSSVQVNADWKPGTDFSQLHTYAWLPDSSQEKADPRAGHPLVSERVTHAIEDELHAQGYEQVDSAADFFVGFSVSVRHGVDVLSDPDYYGHYGLWSGYGGYGYGYGYGYGGYGYGGYGYGGYGYGGYGYGSNVRSYEYKEGTLQIDFVDQQAKTLIWRGTGVSRLSDSQSPEQSTQGINEIVGKVLRQFPPA